MAVPDQLKVSSRSAGRQGEHRSRHANETVAGPALVLSLQRTLGNRATTRLVRSRRPAGALLLQRVLRGRKGVVSGRGKPLDEATGRQILEQFSRGDESSKGVLDNWPEWEFARVDEQEWGLIRETATDEVHLILGGVNSTAWGAYLDEGTPIAHSHPWHYRKRAIVQPNTIDAIFGIEYDRTLVLPTISDFVLPATQGQTSHTVFTPYVVDSGGVVRNPVAREDDRAPRLIWQLTEISLDRSNNMMTGRLTATSGGATVWTHRVQAPTNDRDLATTNYTIIGA